MAKKVLGQVNPAATTLTTLYTVPADTETVVSTLTICNEGATAATVRLSVQVAGAANDAKQYLYWDLTVPAHDTFASTIGMTLAETDVVKAYASSANVAFGLFGEEVSA